MSKNFFAHGKLLLTGEYVALDGALAIAFPTRRGQRMQVEKVDVSDKLIWSSYDVQNQVWLGGIWNTENQTWESVSDKVRADFLKKIFIYLQSDLQLDIAGYEVKTYLEFPGKWGLGSSSTLVSLIAQWLEVNPYKLLQNSFGGSGYDVACATADTPITFQIQQNNIEVKSIQLSEELTKQIAFLFLEKKQNSREGISHYLSLKEDKMSAIQEVTAISEAILQTTDIVEFESLLTAHEEVIAQLMGYEKVKDLLFPDYNGVVKSLGAWGGDFALITYDGDFEIVKEYFSQKGYETLIPYHELII